VSPTVFREGAYRFFFFSREERRAHIHVNHPTGEAKFWLDPTIELAVNYGLTAQRLAKALRLIEEHEDEIRATWRRHFPG
jgi:hypothetical protein